jgi:hypothetical protein
MLVHACVSRLPSPVAENPTWLKVRGGAAHHVLQSTRARLDTGAVQSLPSHAVASLMLCAQQQLQYHTRW